MYSQKICKLQKCYQGGLCYIYSIGDMHPRARRRQGPARMCMCAWKDKYKRKKYSCRRKKCEVETFLDRCATGLLHSIGGMHTKAKLKIICTIEAKDLFKNNRSIERNAPQRKSTTSPTCAWNSAAAQAVYSAARHKVLTVQSAAAPRCAQNSAATPRCVKLTRIDGSLLMLHPHWKWDFHVNFERRQ